MNDKRRKKLKQAQDLISQAIQIIEDARDEEQDSYDNLPESMADGDRGAKMEEAIDNMEDALSDLESASDNIGNAAV